MSIVKDSLLTTAIATCMFLFEYYTNASYYYEFASTFYNYNLYGIHIPALGYLIAALIFIIDQPYFPFANEYLRLLLWFILSFIVGMIRGGHGVESARVAIFAPFGSYFLIELLGWLGNINIDQFNIYTYWPKIFTLMLITGLGGGLGCIIIPRKNHIVEKKKEKIKSILPIVCPNCGYKIYSNALICPICNYKLREDVEIKLPEQHIYPKIEKKISWSD